MCKYEKLWIDMKKRIEALANHGVTVISTDSLYSEMKRSEYDYKEIGNINSNGENNN